MDHTLPLFPRVVASALAGFFLLLAGLFVSPAHGQSVAPPESTVVAYTDAWDGPRYESGRPKVPAELLERMEQVTLEMAWGTLRSHDYHHQVPGFGKDWVVMDAEDPIVGRALTAQYMPARPQFQNGIEADGNEKGYEGPTNTWPIQQLKTGDVYVADGYGKIKGGTLIGDRLGTDIYANSGNGVIFNGSVRDVSGLKEIEGWNHYIRGVHPSVIQGMMMSGMNVPIRMGEATVLPGDVVLATDRGVVFIPPQFAREVVREAEITILTDRFAKRRTEQGVYSSGQMDGQWTEKIRKDFYGWLREHKSELPVPADRIEEIISERLVN
ncbi:MAG: RraA family protein [Salinibacter sp.]